MFLHEPGAKLQLSEQILGAFVPAMPFPVSMTVFFFYYYYFLGVQVTALTEAENPRGKTQFLTFYLWERFLYKQMIKIADES